MSHFRFVLEGDQLVLRVVLDAETGSRLISLADEAHADPAAVASSIIHDVLLEDHIVESLDKSAPANGYH